MSDESYEFKEINKHGKNYKIPLATIQQVRNLETKILNTCEKFVPDIPKMSEVRLEAFIWKKFLAFDIERGVVPGQISHRIYEHTPEFKEWESRVFDLIEQRKKELGI